VILTIQPRDPLIVRDGRPFGAFPGAKVRSYAFPPPQVVAGAVRGRVGLHCGFGAAEREMWKSLLNKVRVAGPLLYNMHSGRLYFPAPFDALLLKAQADENTKDAQGVYRLYRLSPGPAPDGVLTNMPARLSELVWAPENMPRAKPETMPAFWNKESYFAWLEGEAPDKKPVRLQDLGISGPGVEYRTHVKVDENTQAAEEHMLFETSGLEFLTSKPRSEENNNGSHNTLSTAEELAMLVRVEGEPPEGCEGKLAEALAGVHPIGGERRLALWAAAQEDLWPANPPEGLIKKIQKSKQARVVLVTPADFNPDTNQENNSTPYMPRSGQIDGAPIHAAAVGRPLTVSGWDLLAGKPKPGRRLAPAGSVYFVNLSGKSEMEIEAWVKARWMQALPEQPGQSQRDGYGIAVVGAVGGSDEQKTN